MEIGITKTQLKNLLKKGKVVVGENTLKLKNRPLGNPLYGMLVP